VVFLLCLALLVGYLVAWEPWVVVPCGCCSSRWVWFSEVVAERIFGYMGRFFFVEAKSFEFIIESWWNSFS
jgi:hypothetical protein